MFRQDVQELKYFSHMPFKKFACKLFCCFYWSEQLANELYEVQSLVNVTEQLIRFGHVKADLGVYGVDNTRKVLKYLGVPVKSVKVEGPFYVCEKNEYEILKLVKPGFMHFVPGDGKGNYTWDSLGVRPSQKDYHIDSKRIIVL